MIIEVNKGQGHGRRSWTAACKRALGGWRDLDLVKECVRHYGQGEEQDWEEFLDEWLPRVSVCYLAVCTEEKSVLGILLGIWNWLQEGELYVRLLCSGCKWGGRLLERAMEDAEAKPGIIRMALHSEMSCLGFYEKKGFVMMRDGWEDFGRPCPLMLRPLKGLRLSESGGSTLGRVIGGALALGVFFLATLQE
jgi:GNAT superfamily N-acetyltransferase